MIASAAHRLSGAAAGSRPVGLALSSPGSQARLSVTSLRCQQAAAVSGRRGLVVRRFREGQNQDAGSPTEQQQQSNTDTRLSPERLQEVYDTRPGDISPQKAEMRADLGSATTSLSQLSAFDGPIAETLNGRLAMLGAVIGLMEESSTGRSLWAQLGAHPTRVLAVMVVIGVATLVPVVRGFTRKEAFANINGGLPWIPLAENFNGRLAMLGFALMLFSEGVLHMNTLQAWGLQSLPN